MAQKILMYPDRKSTPTPARYHTCQTLWSILITQYKQIILEQKDYLLREIQKIGLIINSIRRKLFGGKENLTLTTENIINDASGMLLEESDFNLNNFLSLNICQNPRNKKDSAKIDKKIILLYKWN